MNKISKNFKNKNSYLRRKSEQLLQWERVIDILRSRADKAKDKNKIEIHNQIGKILVLKARCEYKLKQLQQAGNEKWVDFKASLENSCIELREAFLKASLKPIKD
jgi:hypothetical protein